MISPIQSVVDVVVWILAAGGALLLLLTAVVNLRARTVSLQWVIRVTSDFDSCSLHRDDGSEIDFTWSEVRDVAIVTNDLGPFVDDVFFEMTLMDGSVYEVAQGIPGSSELFDRLQAFPGFDNGAVIRAMGCTDNARFPCWSRTALSSRNSRDTPSRW